MNKMVNIIGFVVMILGLTVGASIPCWYSQTGVVLSPSTIATEDGNLWGYDSEFETGTEIKVFFNDLETVDKEDDKIWLVIKK